MPKIYGLWSKPTYGKDGWARRADGAVLHSEYPQAIAAERCAFTDGDIEVREILIDGSPGPRPSEIGPLYGVEFKAARPDQNK